MFTVLIFLVFFLADLHLGKASNQKTKSTHHSRPKDFSSSLNFYKSADSVPNWSNQTEDVYTDWSVWSRCQNCLQRRMKICLSSSCQDSRMYEERPCKKKRCKRKARQKDEFHVVHLNEDSRYLTKQAPSHIWSRWSVWSPCTMHCKTYRFRTCRKSSRCQNEIQKDEAYCYHERSKCEHYVLNLIENNNRYSDNRRYQYSNHSQNTSLAKPKRKNRRCGVPNRKVRMLKIIGGIEAEKYKWPWHVAIINQHSEVFCGGTLISSRWILTANHCIRKYLRVRINAHDLTKNQGDDIEMPVYKIFPHPKFDYKTVDNDIALLMLPRNVKSSFACLPNKKPRPRQLCSVMGWGKQHPEDFYGIHILHEAKLPIVHSKTCKRSYRQFLISDNMLCAGWASGRADTCAGDSGGGLMCPTKRYSKTVYNVQGITSFGDGCGRKNKYGIYTMVYNYIGWIHYIMDHYS